MPTSRTISKRFNAAQLEAIQRAREVDSEMPKLDSELVEVAIRELLNSRTGIAMPRSEPAGGDRWTPFARGLAWAREWYDQGAESEAVYRRGQLVAAANANTEEFLAGVRQAMIECDPSLNDPSK